MNFCPGSKNSINGKTKTVEYHISRLSVNSLLGHINMNDGWIVTTVFSIQGGLSCNAN
jgi:hypothetical protein